MRTLSYLVAALTVSTLFIGCAPDAKDRNLEDFIAAHVQRVRPIQKQSNLAYWDAAVSGKSEDYDKVSALTLKIRRIYSSREGFAFLRQMKDSGQVNDPLLARQLLVLYNGYLENQIEPALLKEMVDLGTKIEKDFSTFRGTIEGRKVTGNEIKEILKTETDSASRQRAWLASKQVGAVVADDIIRLVKLRNRAARKLGFDNYHTLSMTTGEQDVKELDRIFSELYDLTNRPFAELKADMDRVLADNCGIPVTQLMPWHYHDPFFQESPMVYKLDLDVYYERRDVRELAAGFFGGIGLDVESILDDSDLYEREGKNPHAFCTDIDREGDVRILCNLKNNEYWMETILHELGHAVYDKYQDPKVPFLLRRPTHAFTTEAIAMFFGRLSRKPAWMQQMLGLSDRQRSEIEEVSYKYAQLKQLVFARWAMVMYDFEKQLYADPDQDLNSLWWDMVEKYQLVTRPPRRDEPDWAAKIHFTIAPCYYHNYMLGELLASQLHNHIVKNVLGLDSDRNVSYVGRKEAGEFLARNVFEAGALYQWNTMIEKATGEPLTAEYFVREFIK
jgi:peptidyl-dipeptidase A